MNYKWCRFQEDDGKPRWGRIEDGLVVELDGSYVGDGKLRGRSFDLSKIRFLPPTIPSKVVCVGRNYVEHARELGNAMPTEPLLFLKPPSAVIGHADAIILPPVSSQVEFEGEIGVVIGRRVRNLGSEDEAKSAIFGVTCINDVTARDLQRKDVQFTRAKSFDTFCPVGPVIAQLEDLRSINIETRLNGVRHQHGSSSQMAFRITYLVYYISQIMTLEPGDLIATGTPAGVSRMQAGDVVEVEVQGVGILRNPIAPASI
jgi:2-keto-4-pentenoate hydratase/2-oxohepta-3-ene-1,7-dioic acid hydratase in catechol pathway